MAKKKTEKFVDITKTGAQSYRDLQAQNTPKSADKIASFADASKYFKYTGQQAIATNQMANSQWEDYQEQSPLYKQTEGGDYLGNSIYDDDILIGDDNYNHISDMRGRNQPWYSQLASGLAKGVGLFATTFVDGTLGLVFGASQAIGEGDISKLWDNEVSNGLHDFNQSMEEWLPNYRTEEEQNRAWYENLGTMNFWADGFLKNMGFTIGALYSGGVWNKGLKLVGEGLQFLGKGMEFADAANKATQVATKVGSGVESLGIAMQTNGLGAKLTGSLFSAVNEGRIEANNTTADLRNLQVQQASDAFAKKRQEILDDSSLTEEERIAKMADLDGNYEATLGKIDENLKKAGLTDFLLNVPILAIDNFWTFGRMYSQGFQNAKIVAGKNVRKSVSQLANEAADAAENTLAKNTIKEAGRYAWDNIVKKQSLRKGLMTGLREGNEEMTQAWASEFSGNMAFYADGPDTYYRAMSDPKALQETMDSWEAASKAFANTYGNLDRYEEFAIGALTGLFGSPTFGRSQNASANTWLGRGKMVGISGGILGEFRSDAEMNKNGYAHVTTMNAALDKREQMDKSARIHAAMGQFNDAMDGFAEADDKFEYHNESDNLDWMGITSFISTGREEDLKTLLSQDFDNISDEELESIAKFTAQNDNSDTGGFREKGSGKLITATSPQSDKDAMKEKLQKSKDKMLDEIDSYKTSIDLMRNYAAGNPNVTEEEINELAWMHWKTGRFSTRAAEIKQSNAEQFTLISQALEAFKKKQQEVLDQEEEDTEGLSSATMSVAEHKNAQLAQAKKDAEKNMEYADILLGTVNSVAKANKNMMPALAPLLQINKGFMEGILKSDNFYELAINQGMAKPEFDNVIRDIRDLGRLAEANKTFNDKLKEYMEDPLKQKKDHEKIDQENEAVSNEINRESRRKKAKKATRQQILSGEVNADEVIGNTRADDVERQMAHDAKVTAKVGQRVEAMIANQNQEGTLSDEDAARIESAIQQGIAQSQSINDLTGTNAAFMIDANGQPLSDEQIALIQDLMTTATKEVAEAEGLKIDNGTIDFSKVEEAIQSQTGPTEKQIQEAESAIAQEETKTTGNDAVEKAVAANTNGVQGDPEKAIRKGRPNRGSSRSQRKNQQRGGKPSEPTTGQLKESQAKKAAATKAAQEKATKEAEVQKKNNTVSASLTFGINGNAINISTEEGKQATQLLSNILSKAYDLVQDGKIEKQSGIMSVLQSMDEFEKLQGILGRTPSLGSALKSIVEGSGREFAAEEKEENDTAKLEKTLGPDTTLGERPFSQSFSSQNLNPAINIPNYFAPATSQFYRDPKTGQILPVPFTAKMQSGNKARKKKLEATYNYLTQNEAFKNASRVKAGDDIYFTVHPNLNTAAGGVVILMSTDPEGKHIVGDLADTDSYTYENNTLLKAMVDRITKEFNDRENKESSDPFVSKETSTVRQSMVGHVLFTDSKNASSDKTLNGVFGNGQFNMGVANRAGGIITTNQGDESVSGDLDIITPKTRFTPGTPVVLIPTGDATNKYVAVPFQMSRYDSSMRGTKFHKYAESIMRRVLLNNEGEPIDLSSNKAQVLVKNALNALFNGNFHVNFTNGQLVIHQTIKTVKDGVTEKRNDIIFRGTLSAGVLNNVLNALQSKSMTIRIDRREINKDGNLKDLDFTYNDMMGDLAHTNLSDKSSSTVNDWFIVNPVNEKGEEININRVGYRDTRTEKGPVQRNDTKITYNGNEYLVSEEDIIVDKDGNPRTDVNVTEQQIILAKAEIEKNDLAIPIGTEGEQVFWYSLGNGNLFYNKDGQERVVSSDADKQAVKSNLSKKVEAPTTPKGSTKAELNKNEPTTIETRIIIDSSLGVGMSQVFGYNPNTAKTRNSRADDFWEHRIIEPRDLKNPATGNTRENFYIELPNGTSVITYFGSKNRRIIGRKDGMGINIWRKLTPEEAKTIQDYLWEGTFRRYPEIAEFVDKVMHSDQSSNQSPSGQTEVASEKEAEKKAYPNGFNSQDQKDFFDAMPKERQKLLMDANPNAISAILPYINSVIHDFGIEDLDEAEDDIDDIFDKLTGTKYRETSEVGEYTPIDLDKEVAWLKKALPQLSDEQHLRIAKGLIKISRKSNPGYAYGKTQQGIMTISDAAASGTVYHEAFHSVIDVLLDENEIRDLFNAGARKYGIDGESLDDMLAIEENLAEDFRRYVQRKQEYQKDLSQSSGISKLFKILKHTAKTWLDNTSYINRMFYRINKGKLANRELLPANRSIEHTKKVWGQEEAKNIFFNEVYQKNLNDSDIVRINRKLQNLSDRIGDATWHLQQSKNGGYYIAGYNNRPVTAEDYWSPAFTRYSQFTEEEKSILDKAPRNPEGQLLAPNGKVSNLTEKQYAQVRTKAFKEWFGDWVNVNNITSNINKADKSLVDVIPYDKPWKSDPSKINKTLRIYLKDHSKGYFELVKDEEYGMYSVHFKTKKEGAKYNGDWKTSTKEDRKILFKELVKLIPEGAQVSTWGELSDEGIIGLNNVGRDMTKVGERIVSSKVTGGKITVPIYQKGSGTSKVVDENGEPLVVYRAGEINEDGTIKTRYPGYYFTPVKGMAEQYAKQENVPIREFFLKANSINYIHNGANPIIRSDGKKVAKRGLFEMPWNIEDVNIILEGKEAAYSEGEYLVSNMNQVKSATDNVGTFSRTNDDIRYRKANITPEDIQQYHRERLDYSNLDESFKSILEDRGITEEQYSFLTQAEKENMRLCLI